MQARKNTSRLALAAVVAMAAVAPVAGAVPMYDGHPPTRAQTDVQDMHASTVVAPDEGTVVAADLRTEGTKHEGAKREATVVAADLRTEGAKSPIESTLTEDTVAPSGDLRTEAARIPAPTPPLGMPTWPVDPKPIVPPGPEPVAATDGGDGSFDWPLAGLIAGGAIALAGAAFVTRHQLRAHARPAH